MNNMKKVVAITVLHAAGGDNLYHATMIYRDGHMATHREGIEGSGSYRREAAVAQDIARKWKIYYIPACDITEEKNLQVVRERLADSHNPWMQLGSAARQGLAVCYRDRSDAAEDGVFITPA